MARRVWHERLDRVGRDLLAAMVDKRTVNVRRLGGCRSQEVRFGRFLHNENVTMEAMLAKPPRGEKAVTWTLLTTNEVNSVADAQRMFAWFRRRWTIEELDRTLKSQGLDVEESQIVKASVVKKLCVIAVIAAVQVIQLVRARDGHTQQKLTDGFEKEDQPLLETLDGSFFQGAASPIGEMGGSATHHHRHELSRQRHFRRKKNRRPSLPGAFARLAPARGKYRAVYNN